MPKYRHYKAEFYSKKDASSMAPNQRTGFRLKRNHSNALPRYIISYDSETLPVKSDPLRKIRSHRFRLGAAISGRLANGKMVGERTDQFSTVEQFWDYVYSFTGPRHTTWLVCHNALFDMIVSGMPERFLKGELTIDWPRSKRKREDNNEENSQAKGLCIIESPPTIIAVRVGSTQGRLVIVDTLNWFQTSLSRLGTACGLEKLQMPAFEDSDSEWFRYCTRDAEIVYKTFVRLIKWVKVNDFGMFRYTGPSQAMSAYRHRFMHEQIYVHDNSMVRSLERQSFFGGRTEVFRIGRIAETIHQLDSNSLFPSVMRTGYFPSLLHNSEERSTYTYNLPSIDWSASVAEVEILTENHCFPLRTDDGVRYPIGRFRTTLCGLELQYAKKYGYITGVKSYAEYKLKPLFRLWVDTLWQMRQEYKEAGDTLYAEFTKRLMNSLYGKFGQLSPEWVNVSNKMSGLPWSRWTEVDTLTGERKEFRSFGWQIQKHSGRHELAGTFPAISAFITSAARMRMNWLRQISGEFNTYYQGVDSLIVNNKGLRNLLDAGETSPTEIGKLRLEQSVPEGTIWGCCQYQLGNKLVMGSRSNRFETLEDGSLQQRKFTAKEDLFNGNAIDAVKEMVLPWEMSGVYTKGTVDKDGWVRPLRIGQTSTSSNGGVKSDEAAALASSATDET